MVRAGKLPFWSRPSEFRRNGIMGINSRNIDLIFPFNPRSNYALVDNKALTKKLCESRGIPAPQTYALIERFVVMAFRVQAKWNYWHKLS